MKNQNTKSSNIQGITRLITDATIAIIDLVETMHKQVVHPPFLPSTPIQHLITKIAGTTFKSIRFSTRFIGNSTDKALGTLAPIFGKIQATDQGEALRSVLNGVIGDYLAKKENPLKINMQFRYQGKAFSLDSESMTKAYPSINGKIILMIHGSCMNDIQWTRNEHNHGEKLASELQRTVVYLHYNSGLHISTNGQEFNELLEKLVSNWPVTVEELVIISHSMGGLVSRSALYYGEQQESSWTYYLKKIIFLGTPHHGSPLEKTGNYLDVILEFSPYTKPFARLGKIRSAGVTDLRYGNLLDEDWKNQDRFKLQGDKRKHIPLSEEVENYSIAGVASKESSSRPSKLLNDKVVSLRSSLGMHKKNTKKLNFKKENTWIAYETNHSELLSNLKIYDKIKSWIA